MNLRKTSLIVIATFYFFAGINHFINPHFYYPLIPSYLPFPIFLNYASGFLEVLSGVLFLIPQYRKIAAFGTLVLLILFMPSHIFFITKGGCMSASLCVPFWVAWVRLLPGQLLLMYWAWFHRH
jgi:uncharacterized membrane protein